jgi:hypothetical protein
MIVMKTGDRIKKMAGAFVFQELQDNTYDVET